MIKERFVVKVYTPTHYEIRYLHVKIYKIH